MSMYKQECNQIIDCRKPKNEMIMCEMCCYFCQTFGFIINCTHANEWKNYHEHNYDFKLFDTIDHYGQNNKMNRTTKHKHSDKNQKK